MKHIWVIRVGKEPLHTVYYLDKTFETRKSAIDYKKSKAVSKDWYPVKVKEIA